MNNSGWSPSEVDPKDYLGPIKPHYRSYGASMTSLNSEKIIFGKNTKHYRIHSRKHSVISKVKSERLLGNGIRATLGRTKSSLDIIFMVFDPRQGPCKLINLC